MYTFGRLLSVEKDLKGCQSRSEGSGFDQNTVWDTGLTAPRETGFVQIWHGYGLGKKMMIFGIVMKEVRDVGFSG